VEQWLENQDAGFKVAFNPNGGSYDFTMYDGRRSDAVFTESYRNITDQQYYKQTAGAKNVCLVEIDVKKEKGTGDETEPEPEKRQTITVGNAQGLARREAFVRAGKYDPNELGAQFLRQNEPVESLDVKIINPYTPFEYKKDYDIGDIVTIISQDYGVEITKNILEITEFFDRTGFHLYVVFGKIPRDLLTELRDKDERLDILEKMPEPELPDLSDFEFEYDYEYELTDEDLEKLLEKLKDLIIPDLVDEVFDLLEFPDLITEDRVREIAEDIVNRKLAELGGGGHIIIDHLPTQAEINTYPINAVVLVYNPASPYVPAS
jgi:hypothetical protein